MTNKQEELLRERAIMYRLVVDVISELHGALPVKQRGSLIKTLDMIIIGMEVAVANAEGKRLRPTQIAKRLGIPLQTVSRKLERLVAADLIEVDTNGYGVKLTVANESKRTKLHAQLRQLFERTVTAWETKRIKTKFHNGCE
jgi:DNA-binding MarR family transcriptional regulator